MPEPTSPSALHQAMVDALKQRGDLTDPRVEAAFRAIPRHLFLPGVPVELAYTDDAIPVKRDNDGSILSSSSQPGMIAAMLAQLRLRPGDNVLEIGAGTGYSAALIQHLVGDTGKVTSVELDHDLVKLATDNLQRLSLGSKINIVRADGSMGYAPRASYDRIIASVGVWDVPAAWENQLKPQGILVVPIWLDAMQASAAFRFQPDGSLFSDSNIPCGFIRLRGPASGPRVYQRVGSSSLTLISNHADEIDGAALQMLLSEDGEIARLDSKLTANDYWSGFLPYLVLNLPQNFTFALYNMLNDDPAFGIEGHGFALITNGSAAFVPYDGEGKVYSFASADALIALQDCLTAWEASGRIGAGKMRLRLTPIQRSAPATNEGRVFPRGHHYLHAWLQTRSEGL
jgi:protein-L-isoaspartate(D-aspartate) O-methyltransferase